MRGGKATSGEGRKYKRSTPVIRLRRNVTKNIYLVSLVLDRLRDWSRSDDSRVEGCLVVASEISRMSAELDEKVAELQESGFVPPPKSDVYHPEPGDHVRVLDQSRERYQQLYEGLLRANPKMLDDLVVVRVLPSGEVALRRGRSETLVVARKSHLRPIKVA